MNDLPIPEPICFEDGVLRVLDQTLLPGVARYVALENLSAVWEAIKSLRVRGAPAIGAAAAYGLVAEMKGRVFLPPEEFKEAARRAAEYLDSARPTAVNLRAALKRLIAVCDAYAGGDSGELWEKLALEADAVRNGDAEESRLIGLAGERLITDGSGVLTHCNAGALAAPDNGTALAPVYAAIKNNKKFRVYADETRPLLQGARLTAYELSKAGADVTVICDGAAAYVMSGNLVDIVIVGCDRVAANGDTANKIGTLSVAVAAARYGVPFYVACPFATFDPRSARGEDIPIEERDGGEVLNFMGMKTAPEGVRALNPAFDVTPADLITGFITARGIVRPPYDKTLAASFPVEAK